MSATDGFSCAVCPAYQRLGSGNGECRIDAPQNNDEGINASDDYWCWPGAEIASWERTIVAGEPVWVRAEDWEGARDE